MSPPVDTKLGGKRESGTARILGSGASGELPSFADVAVAHDRYRRVDGLPPCRAFGSDYKHALYMLTYSFSHFRSKLP